MTLVPTRRSFLAGLGALIAAPAIVRVSSLMPLRGVPWVGEFDWFDDGAAHAILRGNSLLTINMITREVVKLFMNSNEFMRNIDRQYNKAFSQSGARIGAQFRIRLPG